MTNTMTLVWGGYSASLYISDMAKSSWDSDKWRYTITDPDGTNHPGRLTGNNIDTAVACVVCDILSRETRLEEQAKALAIEVETPALAATNGGDDGGF